MELVRACNKWKIHLPVNAVFRHKRSSNCYVIVDHVFNVATEDVDIVYASATNVKDLQGVHFSRNASEFLARFEPVHSSASKTSC